jgi:integrase
MRTTFPIGNGETVPIDTVLTQKTDVQADEAEADVKFPKSIRHKGKGKVWAKIYAKSKSYPLYRVTWSARVNGKSRRMVKAFATYADAKRHADARAKELADGSIVTALTTAQASDALAAFERLHSLYVATGRRVSLLSAVCEYCDGATKLDGRTFAEAIDGYLKTAVNVKRMDAAQAVNQFIQSEAPRTVASNGKRPEVSPKYHYNRAIMLRRFAGAFPNTAVSEITKEHVDAFFASLASLRSKSRNRKTVTSAKARNHHRAAIRQFLQWTVRKDYLPATHRLLEADSMRPQNGNESEAQFYTPAELKALLETADGSMRALIAIGGLAGLRTSELLRLTWEDVSKVEGHIEITSGKSKTRQRRLVEIVPALAQWLVPFKESTGKIWQGHEITFQQNLCSVCDDAKVKRKPNGLRHAFCTYHFASHGNENYTAMQAGNSPAMIHAHYKGLATKKEAEKWFAISPEQAGNVIPFVGIKGAKA